MRIEREEIEEKRKHDEERQRLEVIKAKAVVTGPKQVGTIDLNPKKPTVAPVAEKPEVKVEVVAEKPVKGNAKVETTPVVEVPKEKVETPKKADEPIAAPVEEVFNTQYQKLSGATLTGQTIDLSQFNKPKKKKEEPKITPNKPGTPNAGNPNSNANKNKRKRIPTKPGEVRPGGNGTPGANKIVPNTGGNNANRGARPGFVKGNRPAIVAKVEPTEEEVKIKFVKL